TISYVSFSFHATPPTHIHTLSLHDALPILTPKKIIALNEAGLEHLQISIDNIQPDDVSLKSLKVLDKKLEYLADFAEFAVNINSVIGGGIRNPEDAVIITNRAVKLGFSSSIGSIHDGTGA